MLKKDFPGRGYVRKDTPGTKDNSGVMLYE